MNLFKSNKVKVAVGVAATVGMSVANAALTPEAQAGFDAVQANITDTLAAVWVIVPIAVAGWIGVKLFQKGANKAT
ncbi:major coat protein [Vibrio paucivorans]